MEKPSFGIYDALLDKSWQDILGQIPELRTIFGKVDEEEQPARYTAFVAKIIEQTLREVDKPEKRLSLANRIIDLLVEETGLAHLEQHKLVAVRKALLLEITPPHYSRPGIARPQTSIVESSLFTGAPREPQLVHELLEEMRSADEVDILVSFIKWSGLRLLRAGFEELRERKVPVRLITTSYMGASDAPAIEWLAAEPNVEIRISYDTGRTRLHAKAYHFKRKSGFSTGYIGSANMSHAAMTSGLEWNLKVTAQDSPHILEKFTAEFATYWHSREFVSFDPHDAVPLRQAIARARAAGANSPAVFFDLRPHPFQERILEALERESGQPASTFEIWSSLRQALARRSLLPLIISVFICRRTDRPIYFLLLTVKKSCNRPLVLSETYCATQILVSCWSVPLLPHVWSIFFAQCRCLPAGGYGNK